MMPARIAAKEYLRMVDLAIASVNHPLDGTADKALVDYQESIHWPWRATDEQRANWASRGQNWDAHVVAYYARLAERSVR